MRTPGAWAAVLAAIMLGLSCGKRADNQVRVFAAASLADVLEELRPGMSAAAGRPVGITTAASGTLARQILRGAPADLFISASPDWMRQVHDAGHLGPDDPAETWLSNTLVCVVPADAAWSPQGPADLASTEVRALALAVETAPVGAYARAALAQAGVEPDVQIIAGLNARDTLAKVAWGGAQAGIVYATDATLEPRVRVAFTFDTALHDPIAYPMACLNTASNREACDRVRTFLRSPEAADIIATHGFGRPAP